jgi:hypothetical protein
MVNDTIPAMLKKGKPDDIFVGGYGKAQFNT